MKKIAPVQQKEEIISRNILGRNDTMQDKRKNPWGRKNGSFLEESCLKENFRKPVLYAEDQVTLQKVAQKRRKQQSILNKPRSMQMILLSPM